MKSKCMEIYHSNTNLKKAGGVRKYTNIDFTEWRIQLVMYFITQATLTLGENYESFRLGPKPHCQTW